MAVVVVQRSKVKISQIRIFILHFLPTFAQRVNYHALSDK